MWYQSRNLVLARKLLGVLNTFLNYFLFYFLILLTANTELITFYETLLNFRIEMWLTCVLVLSGESPEEDVGPGQPEPAAVSTVSSHATGGPGEPGPWRPLQLHLSLWRGQQPRGGQGGQLSPLCGRQVVLLSHTWISKHWSTESSVGVQSRPPSQWEASSVSSLIRPIYFIPLISLCFVTMETQDIRARTCQHCNVILGWRREQRGADKRALYN